MLRLLKGDNKIMLTLRYSIFSFFISIALCSAQDLSQRPLQKLIDYPSAGGPEHRTFDFELRAFPEDGVLTGFSIGLFDRLGVGFYYGGLGVIGYDKPKWNPTPGMSAQFRILNETAVLPGLAIGFNNQGLGGWDDVTKRYHFKARGFYLVAGKNYMIDFLGEMGFHFGVNQNPIDREDKRLDSWAAIDARVTSQLSLIMEYAAGINDYGRESSHGDGHGYMNGGVRWTFGERLALDLHFRDLLINRKDALRKGNNIGREIRISYVEHL